MKQRSGVRFGALLLAVVLGLPGVATAQGQLLATDGQLSFEGTAGGGIVPLAALAGYGTDAEWGAAAAINGIDTGDYRLTGGSLAVTWHNRLEVSLSQQHFKLDSREGLDGQIQKLRTVGLKARIVGDMIYGPWPQITAGAQFKHLDDDGRAESLGADSDSGEDYYIAVSKVLLGAAFGRNLLLNGVVRHSEANETGFLGFGGDEDGGLRGELSAALFLDRHTAVGIEYRHKESAWSTFEEDDWWDAFIAYFPTKRVSFVAAFADLGEVGGLPDQTGLYLSAQASF